MNSAHLTTHVALILGVLSPCAAADHRANFSSLVENSPFGQPPAPPTATEAPSELGFRGYVTEGTTQLFSVSLTPPQGKERSLWLVAGETNADLRLIGYDALGESVDVEYQGKPHRLKLRKAKIQQVAMAIPSGGQPGSPATPPISPAATPVSEEEQNRLQTIAEEIRRRRALRQSAAPAQSP